MGAELRNEYAPDFVSPPGETLLEILESRNINQAELAERTGRTPKTINEIIKGKARITPETAIQFERVLSIPASFWNNRQGQYDEFLARSQETKALSGSVRWAQKFHYSDMANWGWVPNTKDKLERARNLLNFFGFATPRTWSEPWRKIKVAYRKSGAIAADEYALAAWLRKGELIAQDIECDPYSERKFKDSLLEIRSLTTTKPELFQKELVNICAKCGVAVAFVPELPKTASGATRWLSAQKALIQLSLRYKADDHLWFTFFHEAAHILFHKKERIFIEGFDNDNEEEKKADQFASEFLIPFAELDSFVQSHSSGRLSRNEIKRFAERLGISPGIVVGRLQHDGHLPHSHCNDLKQSFAWSVN